MSQAASEFDVLSADYEELLRDPVRDRFMGGTAGFFHLRKRDLIRDYFRRRGISSPNLRYLDLGCGRGDLLSLLRADFGEVAGCDPSEGMLDFARSKLPGVELRVQHESGRIPFEDGQFDFVTAVCVYHHVAPRLRDCLTAEVRRILKPGGIFAIVEHNPFNPVTRRIVRRTPVDADAILLGSAEARALLWCQRFIIDDLRYFLYLPQPLYSRAAWVEPLLHRAPLGGQYAAFGKLTA